MIEHMPKHGRTRTVYSIGEAARHKKAEVWGRQIASENRSAVCKACSRRRCRGDCDTRR